MIFQIAKTCAPVRLMLPFHRATIRWFNRYKKMNIARVDMLVLMFLTFYRSSKVIIVRR